MSDPQETSETVADALETVRGISALSGEKELFDAALSAFQKQDREAWTAALDRVDIRRSCELVCTWFCSKDCVRRCLVLAGAPPRSFAEVPDPGEFADVVARVTADEQVLRRLVDIVEKVDTKAYLGLLDELDVGRFRHLLCHWVCRIRCELVCRRLCGVQSRPADLFEELRTAGEVIRKLASAPEALAAATKAVRAGDCLELRRVIAGVGLADRCIYICWWFCSWRCMLVCLTVCRPFLRERIDTSDEEIHEFARAIGRLADQPELVTRLVTAMEQLDGKTFTQIVERLKLQRFCVQLCHWLCSLRCRRFCVCVCPPLLAEIDTPAEATCAGSGPVPGCTTASGGPVIGIEITGSAGGGGFDHYTLRYSWGANPPGDSAVVYPGCGRPPAQPQATTPVLGGTLGWLDVTMLPPGVTSFTVYLDVFDAGSGHVADSTTFEIQTRAVQITAVAKVDALDAADPFHTADVIRLIKATADPSPLVPEQSVGGAFSIDGSAYLIGCDRIISQFVLARFDAPPASSAPNPPDAAGGVPLITAVPYDDNPSHPWQSGCFPAITPNTILNGDLVAAWSTVTCWFLGSPYTVPKVRAVPFWGSNPLSGRYVVLLEVRDRAVPAGGFPGTVAAKDQVVVWIDNQDPTAIITSIGGITGCGDLHLKPFVGTTAEVRGISWDPPIDPSAPMQAPNDNFGHYDLSYKKNGEVAALPVTGTTPNTRVPNLWPGPIPAGTDGVLADWDIVTAIDYTGPPPTPPGMLARGERCAFVLSLSVTDTTRVGDGGNHNTAGPFTYAINVINDL
jgi:hypothetical protein